MRSDTLKQWSHISLMLVKASWNISLSDQTLEGTVQRTLLRCSNHVPKNDCVVPSLFGNMHEANQTDRCCSRTQNNPSPAVPGAQQSRSSDLFILTVSSQYSPAQHFNTICAFLRVQDKNAFRNEIWMSDAAFSRCPQNTASVLVNNSVQTLLWQENHVPLRGF